MKVIVRTIEQIEKVYDVANGGLESGTTRYPALTYEDGICAVVEWLFGDTDDNPFDGVDRLDVKKE